MDELVERLRAVKQCVGYTVSARDDDDPMPNLPVNIDGPEAADRILALEAALRASNEALEGFNATEGNIRAGTADMLTISVSIEAIREAASRLATNLKLLGDE